MTLPLASWVDGIPTTMVPADDRGLHYGDGLFETVLLRHGRARFLELHLERLQRGCRRLGIRFEAEPALRADLAAAVAQAPVVAVLKILVSRGSALRRGYAPDGGETPRRMVTLWPATPSTDAAEPVVLAWSTHPVAEDPALAGIKHLNRLTNVLASAEARAAGAFEALMRGVDGRVVSGAMSNVFAIRARTLLTPDIDTAGVAGVLRAVVLREAAALGFSVSVGRVGDADLAGADEVFITNARLGVVPVHRLGEHRYSLELGRRIAEHVEALDA